MRKVRRFFLIINIFVLLLSACMMQKGQNLQRKANKEESIDLSTGKQVALQKLSELRQIVDDGAREHRIREKATIDFIELLQSTLSSYVISAQEFSNLRLNMFECEKQESIQNDISIRFIVFMSYPEIFGTLDRTWTFAEIHKNNKIYIQIIYEKTSEVPTRAKMIQENGINYLLLYGATTMHTPRPLFISFWELLEAELIPGKLITYVDGVEADNVQKYENSIIFEGGQEQWYFDDVITDLNKSILLTFKLGLKTEIIIFFENGNLIAQKK